ncbi:MAG: glycosyltransferase family 4 protein [Abditibacteriales bacterium]|nr:glycosyltransferase family 4 protein [Abditibacteriales bacterium]MDW8367422.1 glycosyltransferase family 4 protein [Abditibacteriales bacterium]
MKPIAYILGTFPSLTETFLLREMVELRRQGVPLKLYALWRPTRGEPVHVDAVSLQQGVTYAPRWWKPRVMGCDVVARHFASQMIRDGICHVHATFANLPATVGMLAAQQLDVPFSFAGHARDIFVEGDFLEIKVAAAKFVVTCTSEGRRALIERCGDISFENVYHIPHGIDVRRYRFTLRSPQTTHVILAVGRLVEKKGFGTLLNALDILKRRRFPMSCVIVGEGPLRAQLVRLNRSLGLTDCVRLVGEYPHEMVVTLMACADVLVVPSVIAPDGDRDGLPNVILEAAALGTPIVASRLPGIAEFMEDEVTGLLVEPNDAASLARAIERVCTLSHLKARMILNARRKVAEQFDVRKNVARLAELFREA